MKGPKRGIRVVQEAGESGCIPPLASILRRGVIVHLPWKEAHVCRGKKEARKKTGEIGEKVGKICKIMKRYFLNYWEKFIINK
jgi:hypothetical protein